mmetsp:Transcript_76769/g.217146  ORF Transcript_76769/g.217146 Transcript_76769/m.217146 type:complete len:581 (-) Transcript_76769:112-1854(-)
MADVQVQYQDLYGNRELLTGLWQLVKQVYVQAHYDSEHGRLQSWSWTILMVASAVKRADLFIEFTKLQAGSQTAIQAFRKGDFWRGRRLMFLLILKMAGAVVVQEFAAGRLKILWRKVSTAAILRVYLDRGHTFYRMKLDALVTNPDHRITSDLQTIVEYVVELAKVLPEHCWRFFGLTFLMWETSRPACLLLWSYALAGTLLTRQGFERNLARHEVATVGVEAHIRFALVRIGECAEGIAFYGAGGAERGRLLGALSSLVSAQHGLLSWTSGFQTFQEVYGRVATMLPSMITAPLFWQGRIEFGAISKMFTSFRAVKEILLFMAANYDKIASISARLQRLEELRLFPERQAAAQRPRIGLAPLQGDALLELRSVRVAVPGGARSVLRWLGQDGGISLTLRCADSVLVQGESGVGKSSLLRAIAGLWDEGTGAIHRPSRVFFLPQVPYMPAGEHGMATTLREQLLYPGTKATDSALQAALDDVGLGHLGTSLPLAMDWVTALSEGEKQRVVFARLLVQLEGVEAPVVLLDESTSACSEALEARLYGALSRRVAAAGGGFVSVGHRSSLKQHHKQELVLEG